LPRPIDISCLRGFSPWELTFGRPTDIMTGCFAGNIQPSTANAEFQSIHFHGLPRTGGRLMTTITISSGVTSNVSTPIPNTTAYLVEGTGVLDVLSGGTVSGPITVKAGGLVTVSSGGKVLSTVISSHGSQTVEAGGFASNTFVDAGGEQDVFGSASGTTVETSGLEVVKSGGFTINTTIVNGGTLLVSSGGVADPTRILAGGTESVSLGGIDSGGQISGGVQKVFGSASGATVFTGSQVIESGGVASNTTVKVGGTIFISSGGVLSNTIVSAGGIIDIEDGGSLHLSGTTVSNAGSINLLGKAGGSGATLVIESNVILSGGGKVSLSSSGNNLITDDGSPRTLTNLNNTISGAGTIGDSDLTLVNSGTIDANIAGGTLTIVTGLNSITNAGLLEANGQVTNLAISGSLTNLGTVEAFNEAANMSEADVSISGTTVTNSNTIVASAVNNFSLASASIIGGTITNSKTIEALANHAANTEESFVSGVLIGQTGPGGADIAISASGTFTNSGTVLGSATGLNSDANVSVVGGGTVINAVSGTMEALATAASDVTLLVSGGTISNSGTIVGSGTGAGSEATLTVSGGTVNNAGTTEVVAFGEGPLAAGSPAASGGVDATNLINTGTLKAAGSGTVAVFEQGGFIFHEVFFGNSELAVSAATLTNSGTLGATSLFGEAETTISGGTVTNSSTIEALGTGYGFFGLGAGDGEAAVSIDATSFTNHATILASATVNGFAAVSVTSGLTNSGIIEALGSAGGLATVDLKGAVNNVSGTLSASGTAFVELDGATVSGGTLTTSHVTELYALSTIIKSAGTSAGVFDGSGIGVFAGGSATVTDATVAAGSYVAAWHHSSLLTLSSAAFGSGAEAQALQGGTVKLLGGTTLSAGAIVEAGISGTVIMEDTFTDTPTSLIVASGAAAQVDLDNATILGGILKTSGSPTAVIKTVSNTTDVLSGVTVASGSLVEAISGGALQFNGTVTNSGTLLGSGGTVTFNGTTTNAGVIEGETAQSVVISGNVVNSKTIEAAGTGASVTIASTISNTPTGLVLASGTGAKVLLSDAVISGGTLRSFGSGAEIKTLSGTTTNLLSSLTIAAGSLVEVSDGSDLTLGGTIVNSGTIQVDLVAGPATVFIAASGATLTGGGTVKMGGPDAFFGSNGTPATLTNINNTISGAGAIADANLTLVNSGTINANNGAASLTINTGAHTITNSGTLEATSTGGLVIDSNVSNFRTIQALGTSTTVTIESTISNTATGLVLASGTGAQVRLDGAVISGGTLRTIGTGAVIETVSSTSNTIAGATIFGGSLVEATSGTALIISGGTIGAAAIVETTTSGTAVVSGTLTNSGTLFASGSGSVLKIASGAVINGGLVEVGNGIIETQGASGANVTFQAGGSGGLQLDGLGSAYTGKVTSFGQGGSDPHQFIDFHGVNFAGESFTYTSANAANTSGTLTVSDGTHSASVALIGHYTQADFNAENVGGTLAITDPTVTYTGALTIAAGSTVSAATGNVIAESTVTNGGTFAVLNGNDIEVLGALTNTGTTEATGTGDINLESTVNNTGTLKALTESDITIQGALTNGGTGTVEAQDSAAMTVEGNITNNGLMTTLGNSQMLLDVPGVAAPTLITNNGTIEAQNDSLITMAPGDAVANTGLQNHGVMEATDNATVLVQASTSSFVNDGTIEADSVGLVKVNAFVTNLGTIAAGGDGIVLLDGSASMTGLVGSGTQNYSIINSGVLKVTGTGTIRVANYAAGGIAQIDGTGTINNSTGAIGGTGVMDTIEFGVLSNVNVSFGAGASGVLRLDDVGGFVSISGPSPTAFSGTVSGFTLGDAIYLPDVAYSASNIVVFVPNINDSGGTLEVENSSSTVLASINLAGMDPNGAAPYVSSDFILNNMSVNGGPGTIITDPLVSMQKSGTAPASVGGGATLEINTPDSSNVTFTGSSGKLVLDQPDTFTGTVAGFAAQDGIDLSQIAFGANTTLGYAENAGHTGGTLTVTDGTHTAAIALLGNYMASTLVAGADGHGGTLVTEGPLPGQPPPALAHPHV
jgi:fibronectin-binding autotransporter adhesin